jgi:hypothetical protein
MQIKVIITMGGGLAGQINNNLKQQEQQQEQSINNAQQNYTSNLNSQNIDPNQASQYVSGALINPNEFTQDANNVSQFQKYLTAQNQYTAPQSFDASQQLGGQVNNYQSLANLTQTEPGRKSLLQNLYNTPFYSSGQQDLDNLLLQASPGQLPQLEQVGNYASQLQNVYNNAQSGTQQLASQVGQNLGAIQSNAQNALSGAINNFGTNAQQTYNDVIAKRQADAAAAQSGLSKGFISQSDFDAAHLPNNISLYGLSNLSNYITPSVASPTQLQAISPEQQSYINSLGKLAGNVLTGAPTSVLSQFQGNNQAGTFKDPAYTFNSQNFLNDANRRQAEYKNQLNNVYQGHTGSGNPVQDYTQFMSNVGLDPNMSREQLQNTVSQMDPFVQQNFGNYLLGLQDLINNYKLDNQGNTNQLQIKPSYDA